MNRNRSVGMKKILISIWLIGWTFCNIYGQARNNLPKLTFDDSSDILSTAIGWAYSKFNGEWIDFDNVICPDKMYKTQYPSLIGTGSMLSRYYQNFVSIQTKSLIFENKKYYVIIIEKWRGYYKYPSINQDWIAKKTKIGVIFNHEEYNKIKNITGKIELKAIGSIESDSDDGMLDIIRNILMRQKEPDNSRYGVKIFPILKSEEGMIRFYIPTDEMYYPYKNVNFETSYFETDPENFSKIILQ
jgi:hypothetical protein